MEVWHFKTRTTIFVTLVRQVYARALWGNISWFLSSHKINNKHNNTLKLLLHCTTFSASLNLRTTIHTLSTKCYTEIITLCLYSYTVGLFEKIGLINPTKQRFRLKNVYITLFLLQNLNGNHINRYVLYKRLLIYISSNNTTSLHLKSNTVTPNCWLEIFQFFSRHL